MYPSHNLDQCTIDIYDMNLIYLTKNLYAKLIEAFEKAPNNILLT